jgi:8-oxo-dGTP pyrophosphatase MutT (NUDIX family)
LEPGEDLKEAARRELLEETGFVPDELVKVDYSYSFPWKTAGVTYTDPM